MLFQAQFSFLQTFYSFLGLRQMFKDLHKIDQFQNWKQNTTKKLSTNRFIIPNVLSCRDGHQYQTYNITRKIEYYQEESGFRSKRNTHYRTEPKFGNIQLGKMS